MMKSWLVVIFIIFTLVALTQFKDNALNNVTYEHDEDGYFVINKENVCVDYVLNLPDHVRFKDNSFKNGDEIICEMKIIRRNMELTKESFTKMNNMSIELREQIEEKNKGNDIYEDDDFDILKNNEQIISDKLNKDDALYNKTNKLLENGIEMQKSVNEFRYTINK